MNKSPFKPKVIKENSLVNMDLYDNKKQLHTQLEVSSMDYEEKDRILFTEGSYSDNALDEYLKNNTKNKFQVYNKSTEPEEYQRQLFALEEKINILQSDLRDQTLKNSDLEAKLKELESEHITYDSDSRNNQENIQKIYQFEVLLKEARKQNLMYSDEIKEYRKKEFNLEKLNEEMNYLKHENLTLKAYFVAQNKMTHYRHAFENLKIENYCTKCSETIQEECIKVFDNTNHEQNRDNEKDIQDPAANKTLHRNVVDILKKSSPHTIQLTNNGDSIEFVDPKNLKSLKEKLPKVNKSILRQITENIDVPLDSLDALARTMVHIGDQVLVRVDWDLEKEVRSTVKYIGNLDERYQQRLFIGVKLNLKNSEIPREFQNSGWFRNKRYFSLNSNSGYFLHFSNIIAIYNKETAQFEDFGDYFHRSIDPTKANRNTRKNNSIKGLLIDR